MASRTVLLGLAAIAAIALAGVRPALSHGGATGIVKERMDDMSAMAKAVKAIKANLAPDGDKAAIRAAADVIRQKAGDGLVGKFPRGSAHPPSEARMEIWSELPEFQRLAGELEIRAAALSDRPGEPAFKALLQTCAACHKRFRQKRN